MIRSVLATRYVVPLREGGSLPAILEADDLGLYVTKFRGAGQGAAALVAELVAGEIGRLLGLSVPELVLVELDPVLGRNEPDAEIRHLLTHSAGTNVGLDFLPGAADFSASATQVPSEIASLAVWFDAFTLNVDRTPRNPNLLLWHGAIRFIDHGAALYFHHNWEAAAAKARSPFVQVAEHVLLPFATALLQAARYAHEVLTLPALAGVLADVPDTLLGDDAEARRQMYLRFFAGRMQHATIFEQEALRAHERQL